MKQVVSGLGFYWNAPTSITFLCKFLYKHILPIDNVELNTILWIFSSTFLALRCCPCCGITCSSGSRLLLQSFHHLHRQYLLCLYRLQTSTFLACPCWHRARLLQWSIVLERTTEEDAMFILSFCIVNHLLLPGDTYWIEALRILAYSISFLIRCVAFDSYQCFDLSFSAISQKKHSNYTAKRNQQEDIDFSK